MLKKKSAYIVLAFALTAFIGLGKQASAQATCDDTTVCSVTGSDPDPVHPNAVNSPAEEPSSYLLALLILLYVA